MSASFDPEKAYDELLPLPPAADLEDVDILKKVNKTNIALSRLGGASLAVPNRALLQSVLLQGEDEFRAQGP